MASVFKGNGDGAFAHVGPGANRLTTQNIDFLPPQNLEAEQGVLAAILLDPEVLAIEEVARLTRDDFFRDAHQVMFDAIRHLEAEGKGIDHITLAEELERRGQLEGIGGDLYLGEVAERIPHTLNAKFHAEILRQKALARFEEENARETINDVRSNSFTSEQLIERARERSARVDRLADQEIAEFSMNPWPDAPEGAVWHGLAGDIVELIEPHTESDPMAILGQFLVGFGNIVGRNPYWRVEATRHHCNLFMCIVGNSAKARKGTSWGVVHWILGCCQPEWSRDRIFESGLSSGEGLIQHIRDALVRREKTGKQLLVGVPAYQDVEVDPGVEDKRALCIESEFGGMLSAASREGNILSKLLRNAWDSIPLRSDTKNTPVRCMQPHVSLIGHVTYRELHRRLSETDLSNGFANRFLWLCVKRSKCLSRGGQIGKVNFTDVFRRLAEAIEFATFEEHCLVFDEEAGELWDKTYPELTAERPGVMGDVTSRSDPQTLRLAMIYALLDCSPWIKAAHLRAALAFWRYCEQSATFIFGDMLSDPVAEKLLANIQKAGEDGLTKTQLTRLFGGHKTREAGTALTMLMHAGLILHRKTSTGGRSREVWTAVRKSGDAKKAK